MHPTVLMIGLRTALIRPKITATAMIVSTLFHVLSPVTSMPGTSVATHSAIAVATIRIRNPTWFTVLTADPCRIPHIGKWTAQKISRSRLRWLFLTISPGGGAAEPEQAEHREHQRHEAIADAVAGPHSGLRERVRHDKAGGAHHQHPDQFDRAAD